MLKQEILRRRQKTFLYRSPVFLSYARQVLEQAGLLEEKFLNVKEQRPRFSVSCQHYSFAVNAFADVIRSFGGSQYDFTLRETQTYEIIEDVSRLKSEIGILYTSSKNEEIISKLVKQNDQRFEILFVAKPLLVDEPMTIGTITQKNMTLSRYGKAYMDALRKYKGICFTVGKI